MSGRDLPPGSHGSEHSMVMATAFARGDAATEGAASALAGESGNIRRQLRRHAFVVVLAYAATAGLWIAASDPLLGTLIQDPRLIVQVSLYKGLGFVATTALLLHLLLLRLTGRVEAAALAVENKEAERLLHEARRRHADAIIESTDDAIISHDSDGLITSWNPAARDIFGYESSEVLGRSVDLLIPADRTDEKASLLARMSRGEPVRHLETTRRRKDGTQFPAAITLSPLWSAEPVPAPERTLVGFSEVVRDISERKDAEAAAEKAHGFANNLVEALPGIFYLYDQSGRFLRWNRDFEEVSGYSAAEVAQLDPLDLFPDGDKELVRDRIAEVFARGESSVEASFLAKDGTATPYFFTGRRISFEGSTCLIGVGVDIAQRRLAEAALRELNDGLEQKVSERTRELETALLRAEAADRIKSAFLATMSHELRTPLNSIIGFTGIVLQELAGPLNAEQSKQLGMVRSSARHLLDLINDVLDISKIEAGQLEIRNGAFDLREVVERVGSTVAPLAAKKGLTLHVAVSDAVGAMVSDRRRVEQVLLNLMNNAIKFTDAGTVTLEVELQRDESASQVTTTACFRVSDTGIGMKEEALGELFQPFRQIDSGLQRQHEGTGLGLAICQRLTHLLGGTIRVESAWGRGSVFTVTLPMERK